MLKIIGNREQDVFSRDKNSKFPSILTDVRNHITTTLQHLEEHALSLPDWRGKVDKLRKVSIITLQHATSIDSKIPLQSEVRQMLPERYVQCLVLAVSTENTLLRITTSSPPIK